MTDWNAIKTEYISTSISQRALAEKYGVSPSTLRYRAKREGWDDERCAISRKTAQATAAVIVERGADRASRILSLSDRLADRIEQAIEQLDRTTAKTKTRVREIEYGDSDAKGKPTREIITEEENIVEVSTIVDRLGLQQLTTALKNIKDINAELDSASGEDSEDDGLLAALSDSAGDDWEENSDDSTTLPVQEDEP